MLIARGLGMVVLFVGAASGLRAQADTTIVGFRVSQDPRHVPTNADSTRMLHVPFRGASDRDHQWQRAPTVYGVTARGTLARVTSFRWVPEDATALEIRQPEQQSMRALRSGTTIVRLESAGISVRYRVEMIDMPAPGKFSSSKPMRTDTVANGAARTTRRRP